MSLNNTIIQLVRGKNSSVITSDKVLKVGEPFYVKSTVPHNTLNYPYYSESNGNTLLVGDENETELSSLWPISAMPFEHGSDAHDSSVPNVESGTWTCKCTAGNARNKTSTCNYLKVGKMVRVWGDLAYDVPNLEGGTSWSGLPFAANGTQYVVSASTSLVSSKMNGSYFPATFYVNNTTIQIESSYANLDQYVTSANDYIICIKPKATSPTAWNLALSFNFTYTIA